MRAGTLVARLVPEGAAPENLEDHLERFGPRPRPRSSELLAALDASGLRGRGGAEFPTATKWRAVVDHAQGRDTVVVANAAECEPASFKDRTLVGVRPHLVLDGLEHAAETVGARRAVVYMSRSHEKLRHAFQAAIVERRQRSDCEVFIEVLAGPDRYVAGEETAIVARVSGRLAKPRVVPPRPFHSGVGGLPTLVQNVETLGHVALVARHGPDWFRSVGTRQSPGTALLTVTGGVAQPGVVEVAHDATFESIVAWAGGTTGEPAAILVGGYFGRWIGAERVWQRGIDAESLRSLGVAVGAGVVAVLPAAACGVAETDRVLSFLAEQSAGQCGPCHVGLPAIADMFHRVAIGRARPAALDMLSRWCSDVVGRGACRHPDGAVQFLQSALQTFAADVRHHARAGGCRFSDQPAMLTIPSNHRGWW